MSRSVSTHRHAVATVYLQPDFSEENQDFAWQDFIEDLRSNVLPEVMPSLSECSRWMDREDHVIAENGHAEVSVSEYCGLVAICLAPIDADNAFKVAWCERAAGNFEKVIKKMFASCALNSMGRASNGEQFFSLTSVPGSVVTSKEGRLPMFP